jgi:hypothetical protein
MYPPRQVSHEGWPDAVACYLRVARFLDLPWRLFRAICFLFILILCLLTNRALREIFVSQGCTCLTMYTSVSLCHEVARRSSTLWTGAHHLGRDSANDLSPHFVTIGSRLERFVRGGCASQHGLMCSIACVISTKPPDERPHVSFCARSLLGSRNFLFSRFRALRAGMCEM